MSRVRTHSKLGFTLIEVLVAAAFTAVAVAASMGAMSSLEYTEAKGRDKEALSNLAEEKMTEIVATTDFTQATSGRGDFTDRNDTDHTWSWTGSPINVSSNAPIVNTASTAANATVDEIVLTVASKSMPDRKLTIAALINVPQPTGTATGAAGAGG